MKKALPLLTTFLLIYCTLSSATGSSLNYKFSITEGDITLTTTKGFTKAYLKEGVLIGTPGAPQLPQKNIHFLLPTGCKADSIAFMIKKESIIAEDVTLFPAQEPAILPIAGRDMGETKFTPPSKDWYAKNNFLPEEPIRLTQGGNMGGFSLCAVTVSPLQYNPSREELKMITTADIQIFYSQATKGSMQPGKRSPVGQERWTKLVGSLVKNPDLLAKYSLGMSDDAYDYLIITTADEIDNFAALAKWKRQKGIKDTIVSVETISAVYSGEDILAKIRACITDCYTNLGITWVFLGGDVNLVEARITFAMDSEAGLYSNENELYADLYLSDLDGSWNSNRNSTYGEVNDAVDMYPDVLVGRASLESVTEIDDWVRKQLIYEKHPPADYLHKALFLAEVLWKNPRTDAGIGADMIIDEFIPPEMSVTRLYESLGNEDPSSVIDALATGNSIVNHDGHGNTNLMSVGSLFLFRYYLHNSDIDSINSDSAFGIVYSIGCWVGAFDDNCIAEHFLSAPEGGSIAFIGNNRYGWGSPGNPGYGYSDLFSSRFYKALFDEQISNIASALAYVKSFYVPYADLENVWRWHEYQVNLLGDPEFDVRYGVQQNFSLEFPHELPLAENTFDICVKDAETNSAVAGALVGVTQNNRLLGRALTDFSGCVSMTITPKISDSILVTVTKHNFIPGQTRIAVNGSTPYLNLANLVLTYPGGDTLKESEISYGDSLDLSITIKNCGALRSDEGQIKLTPPEDIFIGDTISSLPALAPDAETTLTTTLIVHFFGNDHYPLNVRAALTTTEDTFNTVIPLYFHRPVLKYYTYYNPAEIVAPGDTIKIKLATVNKGSLEPTNPVVVCSSPDISFSNTNMPITTLDQNTGITDTFTAIISEAVSTFGTIPIYLDFYSERGFSSYDTLRLPINIENITYDMEDGSIGWNTPGSGNHWTIAQRRSNSPNYSWWCGRNATGCYTNNANDFLVSDFIHITGAEILSCFAYFNVVNYGTDGVYIKLYSPPDTIVLDYLGSGGALDSTLDFIVDWAQYSYDLSELSLTDSIKLIFQFKSDSDDVAEGFYIDDISLEQDVAAFPTSLVDSDEKRFHESNGMISILITPNPFRSSVEITLNSETRESMEFMIVDLLGNPVYRTKELVSGVNSLTWQPNQALPHGLYIGILQDGEDVISSSKLLYIE